MLDCVLGCISALSWCVLLIAFFLFMFSLALVQGMSAHVREDASTIDDASIKAMQDHYGSVGETTIFLFMAITGGMDWNELYTPLTSSGPLLCFIFIMFVCFFTLAVWNIVTSIFVERALKLAMPDVDTLVKDKRLKDIEYASELTDLIKDTMMLTEDNPWITYDEFHRCYISKEFRKLRDFFNVRGLNLRDAHIFFRMLASVSDSKDEVHYKTFVHGCLRLQGLATSLDLQAFHFEVKDLLSRVMCNVFDMGLDLSSIKHTVTAMGADMKQARMMEDIKQGMLAPNNSLPADNPQLAQTVSALLAPNNSLRSEGEDRFQL